MYAKGVTADQLKEIGRLCNFEVNTEDEGSRVKFTLRNNSEHYHVISRSLWGSDRKYRTKVCYHGHWEFFELLFEEYPDAVVTSSYYGRVVYKADSWKPVALEMGSNVLRPYDGLTLRDKCDCESNGWSP